ncbi:GNAT family N-acetyltransferase [Halovenus rubra]|uniref:GNAT family N-acetyltransferase n=2 Tax=Halovenus rubra TaxID=869890 RepID=A0ABD5XH38_9EURY|nr:GNAT family N-acetyltransferase [Halovenus rubra]
MAADIRPATPEDAEAMRDVAERAWEAAHSPIIGEDRTRDFLDTYYDVDSLHEVINRERWITHVADADGAVTGFVSGGPSDEDPTLFHLGRLYIAPKQWGNGIGGQLLAVFERQATERGASCLSLQVMAENERAVGFYESTGYERNKRIYDETIETDAYVYTKSV